MKKIIYVAMAAVLLSSCTGTAPFSKARYGHLKWIKKGAVVEAKSHDVTPFENTPSENKSAVNTATETKPSAPVNENTATPVEVNTITQAPVADEHTQTPTQKNTDNTVNTNTESSVSDVNVSPTESTGTIKPATPDMSGDVRAILAIIFAIVLPPVGVYITRQSSSPFVLVLILCLVSFVGFFFIWAGLLWLIAIIVALIAVLEDI